MDSARWELNVDDSHRSVARTFLCQTITRTQHLISALHSAGSSFLLLPSLGSWFVQKTLKSTTLMMIKLCTNTNYREFLVLELFLSNPTEIGSALTPFRLEASVTFCRVDVRKGNSANFRLAESCSVGQDL